MVGDAILSARHFIIATGARPIIPPINGLDTVEYLTHEKIWDLTTLPRQLTVIGGGPIGCELAQALCRLGAGVTVLEDSPRILLQEEPEVSELVQQQMAEDDVMFRLNSRAQHVWNQDGEIHIIAGGQELTTDALLLSVGRRPAVDGLDLVKAGVDHSRARITSTTPCGPASRTSTPPETAPAAISSPIMPDFEGSWRHAMPFSTGRPPWCWNGCPRPLSPTRKSLTSA